MPQNAINLVEKIQTLSASQQAEVEKFIEFLRFRTQRRESTPTVAAISEATFQTIWINPEDDAYDAL